jgi:hypothetical protein
MDGKGLNRNHWVGGFEGSESGAHIVIPLNQNGLLEFKAAQAVGIAETLFNGKPCHCSSSLAQERTFGADRGTLSGSRCTRTKEDDLLLG